MHGSDSYRVPWAFDDEAVDVARLFTKLKLRLMPYLFSLGEHASRTGEPLLRAMAFEFPDDPATKYLDQQYMLGSDLLVAPVFSASEPVTFYLPPGTWYQLLTGDAVAATGWRTESHGFQSLPLYIREGSVIAMGTRSDRPDYDYLEHLNLLVAPAPAGLRRTVTVFNPDGRSAEFSVAWEEGSISLSGPTNAWSASLPGGASAESEDGRVSLKTR